ncbi:MAG: Predicted exporter of the RND superfamily [uncultured Sulfurovum sp.]|uniref:Predicted exporter of the RND superfamily n=1 Tax=uncultured Sulfurovum sp. TaxID=269237 RepID=A0A6S6TNQ6_9BACT|nr:MAG: Predicted exporter of the RND superfamily [uncultured Sulfurovum sp.]
MHQKLENIMGQFGSYIHDNPFKILLVLAVLLAFPISHVPQIKMDTSTEGFMHEDDPVLLTYNNFREQFGRDERIMIAIQNDNIFSLDFLNQLKNLHKELESNVPYLDDITSLYNVRNTRGEGDKLITDDLLEPFPSTQEEVAQIKERAMSSHFYKDLFISQDAKMTTIVIETDAYSHKGQKEFSVEDEFSEGFGDESTQNSVLNKEFLSDQENQELLKTINSIADKYRAKGLEIYIAGSPAVNNALKAQMRADMQKFMRITFLIILVFLFVVFRRLSAVFYPLLVILFSLLATVGTMAWTGVAFKLPTQIVPSLLLAVSVGATVHILSIFFDQFNKHGSRKQALSYALRHSGLAIAMTSVTTAIGVGSFAGSEVAPISDLGIFAAVGVMVSLILTLTLLPALLSITKLKPKAKIQAGKIDKLMKKLAVIPVRHTKAVLVGSFLIVALSLMAATQVNLSHNPLKWFQPDNINRVSTEVIDEKMNGSVTIEIVIDTGKENGWVNSEKLERLNAFSDKLEAYQDEFTHIGKVVSLATIVKETNRALHENKEAFYTIPKEGNLVSQELLLFENSGSDDLEDVVDSQFSKARVTVKLPWTDSIEAVNVLNYVRTEVKKSFPDERVETTGMVPLLINTFSNSINSSVFSYTIAGIAITFMMMLILGSARLGLLSMIPNLTPIIMGLLIMYLAKMPLDMFTLLIGSIAIGLAVDDTIHFMHNFKRYYLESGDAAKAIEQTFYTTGKAMVITTLVLALGFYAYIAAYMISVQNFGILTGSVIVFALLSDLLLAPALMIVAAKRGWIK